MQNTSGALTVPSFRRLPLFTSMSDTFVPGTIEPLAVLQNRFRLCSICSNRHVTAAFFPFPCISSYSFFTVLDGKKSAPRERFTQAASVLNISQPAISCQALYCFFSVFFYFFFSFSTLFLLFPTLLYAFLALCSGSGRSGRFGTYFHFVF